MGLRLSRVNTPLLAIIAEGVISRFSFGAISFALPLYARHLGLSLTAIGFLVSLNVAVALALKPLSGWAADRIGLKRSFAGALALRSVVPLLLAISGIPLMLYVARSLHGVSKSMRDPSVNALIAEHGGEKTLASAFAWYSTGKGVSASLGRGAAGILLTLTASNFSLVFGAAFATSILAMLVVMRYVTEPGREKETPVPVPQVRKEPTHTRKPGSLGTLLPFIGMGFFVTSSGQMLHGLFPIFAIEYAGLSEAEIGIIYMATTIVILFAGPLFGWLSDHVSRKLVLLTRGVSNVLSSLIYLVAPNLLGVASGRIADDVGKAAFRPAWGSIMAQVSASDPQRRARTMAYMSMGQDGGEMVGPILASFVWSVWGIPMVLGLRIILAIGAELYVLLMAKHLKEPREIEEEESLPLHG